MTGVITSDEFISFTGRRCAVLGRPIAHSLSPVLHTAGYNAVGVDDMTYYRIEAGEIEEIKYLLDNSPADVQGFSVTMPGKHAALELADSVTPRAQAIGSANTLVSSSGWLADNTDVDGVTACLDYLSSSDYEDAGIRFDGAQAVVIGNGGTARPAIAALAAAGVKKVSIFARSERALQLEPLADYFHLDFSWLPMNAPQQDIDGVFSDAAVVISTVPASVAERYADSILRAASLVDVIYDPFPTPLLHAAMEKGLPVADGLRMLAGQAEVQFRLFTGCDVPEGVMLEAVKSRLGI